MELQFFLPFGGSLTFTKDKPLQKFDIRDVVMLLANENRYYNLIQWSVLQHCLACYFAGNTLYYGNDNLNKYLLVHDFHEAFTRDVPRCMKDKEYGTTEKFVQEKLLQYLEVSSPRQEDYEYFKIVDDAMAYIEAKKLSANYELIDAVRINTLSQYKDNDRLSDVLLACQDAFNAVANMPLYVTPPNEQEMIQLNPQFFEIVNEALV